MPTASPVAAIAKLSEELTSVFCKETHGTVVRLAPPLVILQQDLAWGLERVKDVVEHQKTKERKQMILKRTATEAYSPLDAPKLRFTF